MFKIILFFTILVAFSYGNSNSDEKDDKDVDYCDKDALRCKQGDHIGCGSLYDFDPKLCKKWKNLEVIKFTDDDIQLIVDEHNKARNATAGGETVRGLSATRMCKMKWDDSLALMASFNAYKCLDDHDKCRNTKKFCRVGQNLYNCYATYPTSVQETIVKAVSKWNGEYKDLKSFSDIDALSRSFFAIGHYTQMMKDNACFVGCFAVKWSDGSKISQYWICNYSSGNLLNKPVFERGETASKCEKRDKYYSALCSSSEVFDIGCKNIQKGGGGNKRPIKFVKTSGGGGGGGKGDNGVRFYQTFYKYRF